jgi:hypothetical protein
MTLSGLIKDPANRLLPFNFHTYTKNAKELREPAADLSLPYAKEIFRVLRGDATYKRHFKCPNRRYYKRHFESGDRQ